MSGGVWLASLFLFPLAGFPLLSHRAYRTLPAVSRAVLAGACGAILVSFAMTLEVLLGVRWQPAVLVAAGAGFAFLLRIGLGRSAPPVATKPEPSGGGGIGAAASFFSALAFLAALAATWVSSATSPDLLFFWGPKAQQFAIARSFDPAFMRDPFHQHMHAYYPPLVSNLGALASMVAGRMSWTGATLTFPLLLLFLAAGLPGILASSLSRARAAGIASLTVAAIALLGIEADIAGNGEMPLLLFETLALALLVSPLAAEGPYQLLSGLLLAGAAATKVEGLPFMLSAVALFLFAGPHAPRPAAREWARLLLPAVLALSAWFAFGATRRIFYGYSGYGRIFDLHPDHLPTVLSGVFRALWSTGHGLPWLIPLGCLLAALPLSRRALLPLGTAAILIGFFLFTYIHRVEDPSLWISWSAARVFSPIAMLLALASICGPRSSASAGAERERRAPASPG